MGRRGPRSIKVKWNAARQLFEPVILEEHVVREIVERLWLQEKIKMWRVKERIPDDRKRRQELSTPGIPDLFGWTSRKHFDRPVPIFIECKRPGGARRPAQERFITEALEAGCIAFFAESWHDVAREFLVFGIKLTV